MFTVFSYTLHKCARLMTNINKYLLGAGSFWPAWFSPQLSVLRLMPALKIEKNTNLVSYKFKYE